MSVWIEFIGGPLHRKVAEFDERPRKYSIVANNTLYRYWIDDAETGTEPEAQAGTDDVLRGVEIKRP